MASNPMAYGPAPFPKDWPKRLLSNRVPTDQPVKHWPPPPPPPAGSAASFYCLQTKILAPPPPPRQSDSMQMTAAEIWGEDVDDPDLFDKIELFDPDDKIEVFDSDDE